MRVLPDHRRRRSSNNAGSIKNGDLRIHLPLLALLQRLPPSVAGPIARSTEHPGPGEVPEPMVSSRRRPVALSLSLSFDCPPSTVGAVSASSSSFNSSNYCGIGQDELPEGKFGYPAVKPAASNC